MSQVAFKVLNFCKSRWTFTEQRALSDEVQQAAYVKQWFTFYI